MLNRSFHLCRLLQICSTNRRIVPAECMPLLMLGYHLNEEGNLGIVVEYEVGQIQTTPVVWYFHENLCAQYVLLLEVFQMGNIQIPKGADLLLMLLVVTVLFLNFHTLHTHKIRTLRIQILK